MREREKLTIDAMVYAVPSIHKALDGHTIKNDKINYNDVNGKRWKTAFDISSS